MRGRGRGGGGPATLTAPALPKPLLLGRRAALLLAREGAPLPPPSPAAGAAHAQFADAGCVANAAADLLCGRGRGVTRRAVAELTATPMLAWLWQQLEGQVSAPV